jgi:hypothetical protein
MKYYSILFILLIGFFSCEEVKEIKNTSAPNATTQPVLKQADELIKVLWLVEQYDPQFKENVPVMQLNKAYLQNISDAERAIIAYYATFHGNECWWENDAPNEDRSNLKCTLISALNLSYQCSDTHLSFIKKWFRQPELLNELDFCPTIPNTSTIQDAFEEMYVERNGDFFTIRFNICAVNIRENRTRCYEEVHQYQIFPDKVELIKNATI